MLEPVILLPRKTEETEKCRLLPSQAKLPLENTSSLTEAYLTYLTLVSCGLPWCLKIVKNPPAMWETWVRSLCWEAPLEEGTATHSSILAWRIPLDRGAWQATVYGVAKS